MESNGIGLKIVGGREMPDSTGRLAAYIAKIFPEKLSDSALDIHEGDVVLKWNGIWLDNKTFEEVASIIQGSSSKEVELVIRSDYDILTGKPRPEEDKYSIGLGKGGPHPKTESPQDDSSHDGHEPQRSSRSLNLPTDENLVEDFTDYYGMSESTGREINSKITPYGGGGGGCRLVRSPSSSTEATNTSASTSIRDREPLMEEYGGSRFPQHLIIPSEGDLRKRSTTSLPPSFVDRSESEQHSREQANRKGSENISVKSMRLSSPERKSHAPSRGKKGSYGQIQLQICHDPRAYILYVTVLKARLPKQRGEEENMDHFVVDHPYVTVFLLPDRILENQRRTRHIMATSVCPMWNQTTWNQTMVYPNVTGFDLKDKYLEVAVRNYNPNGMDGLLGKIILYLSDEGILDEQPHSYSLRLEEKPYRRRSSQSQSHFKYSKSQRYSGASDSRRASDDTRDPEDEVES